MFFCKSLSNLSKVAMQIVWSHDTDICLYPHFSWLVLMNFAFMFTDQRMIISKTTDRFPRVLQTTDSRIGNDHDWCNRRRNWNDWKDSNVRQMSLLCPYCTMSLIMCIGELKDQHLQYFMILAERGRLLAFSFSKYPMYSFIIEYLGVEISFCCSWGLNPGLLGLSLA